MDSSSTYQCASKPYWNPGAKIDNKYVDYNCNEDKIMYMIQSFGSAVIGLYASDSGFKNYNGGVFDTCSYPTNNINHAGNVYFDYLRYMF